MILLLLSTIVPAWIWILLGIADVALIVLQFRVTPAWRGITVGLMEMLFVSLVAIVNSQFFTMTPSITDASGEVIPDSIAKLEKVKLNGSEQWVSIRGCDRK